jgi:exodeoxyribonuclease-5
MKINKIRNGVIALIEAASRRLKLTNREFIKLQESCRENASPSLVFAACCLMLESDDKLGLRQKLKDDEDLVFQIAPALSNSYSLLYEIVEALYHNSPRKFFDSSVVKNVIDSINTEDDSVTTESWVDPFAIPTPVVSLSDNVKTVDRRRQDAMFGSTAPVQKHEPIDRPDIPWNDEQNRAFHKVFAWYKDTNRKQIFRLFGFAGSGKTTMAKEIAWVIQNGENMTRGEVLFASYTGKAAAVLLSKGCNGASTIHSLIYRPRIDQDTGQVCGFSINDESPLRTCSLLIVDEVSTVNTEMALDLQSFGVSILVLGDPKQLKPIEGEGYFTQATPDVMLETIERQAKDNPIIYLATRARQGLVIKPGRYGDSRVYAAHTGGPTDGSLKRAEQILVGMNRTREAMNKRYRIINGKYDVDTQFPVKGDRLMCLKNNKNNGLLNGTIWQCTAPLIKPIMKLKDYRKPELGLEQTNIEGLHFKVRSFDLFDSEGSPLIVNTVCSTHHFDTNLPDPPWRDIAGTDKWTFGYSSSIHKAQGSQWAEVVLIDESHVFQDQKTNHLYTAITRASEKIRIYLT